MKLIEERLRGLIRGEKMPPNTRDFATVRVPVGWLTEAISVIEQYRREDENYKGKTLPSNLWY